MAPRQSSLVKPTGITIVASKYSEEDINHDNKLHFICFQIIFKVNYELLAKL